MSEHNYKATITWTGNEGKGTADYRGYQRNHTIVVDGKPEIPASSDPSFRGDKSRYNPEELLVASLSSCHMLWYLHLCSVNGVIVVEYSDHATGVMIETNNGGGHFKEVTLHPEVTLSDETMIEKAKELHYEANKMCFIAIRLIFLFIIRLRIIFKIKPVCPLCIKNDLPVLIKYLSGNQPDKFIRAQHHI